jgi:Domain of unknown function (DUF6371)
LETGKLEKAPTGKFPAFQFPTFARRLTHSDMPTKNTYRYTLQPYAGPKSRTTCPDCGKPRSFTHYLDNDTGELLPDAYGRCDREINCAYHLNPYHIEQCGTSYAQRVRLDAKLNHRARPLAVTRLVRPLAAAPIVSIPADVFKASLGHYERNVLAQLLRAHFGLAIADDLLSRFHLGTSRYWPGACIFWLLDEQGRVRGGQVVQLDETGHTVKLPWPGSGDRQRRTDWIHTVLTDAYRKRGTPLPTWLAAYQAKDNKKAPCLFGLPQLATAPAAQRIGLVESAKTAIMATPYSTRYVWMATMGQSYLTAERLEPLRGRRIVLFPDAGAYKNWQAKSINLNQLGFDVTVSKEMENVAAEDPSMAKGDLADVLLKEWPGYPPSWHK